MTFQTLSVPSQGWRVLMSTDWLTVRVPPDFGCAATGACWAAVGCAAGAAVGCAAGWAGLLSAGLAGALVAAGGAGGEQAATRDVPSVAASPRLVRVRNWRRVSGPDV